MNKYLIFLIATLFLVGIVGADVIQTNRGYEGVINDDGSWTKTTTPVNNFNVIGFICLDDGCNNVNGTLWSGAVLNSGNSNEINLVYPKELQQKGYGLYFYKEGYFPFEAKSTLAGSGTMEKPFDVYFTKKQDCRVPINNLSISHYGNKIIVNVTLYSSVSSPVQNAGPLNYQPDSIAHLYAVDALVNFSLVGPDMRSSVKDVNLPASESRVISASFDNLKAGDYRLSVESMADDVKCINSVPLKVYSNLLIEDNRTNVTLPTVSILSPESKTYNTKNLLVNIRSTDANSVWYNWNGQNISYTSPLNVTFNEGKNILVAYAANNITTAISSVTFYINTSNGGNGTNDTVPPAKISNLHLVEKSKNSIKWAWNNPGDMDFMRNIIYINGVFAGYTQNNVYEATGLSSGSKYTITIKTQDYSGNVNHDAVSDSQTTLSDDKDDDSHDKTTKKKILRDLGPRDQTNETVHQFSEDDQTETLEPLESQAYDSSKLFVLLLIVGIVLLLLLVIALLLVR